MSGAAAELQAAALAALQNADGIGGVYDGPPLQAAFPYAIVECGPESDWSHKDGEGREVRLAVIVRDAGERAGRLPALMAAAEAALDGLGSEIAGWRVVTLRFVRSRTVKEPCGGWAGTIEYRARMLAG
ncbi:MAG TPA: DUF3168 domain-containing protein [Allosphingosinicella sp.]|nr:DUF3168 domain-containing protein [Allosphingosinicella sp.]